MPFEKLFSANGSVE